MNNELKKIIASLHGKILIMGFKEPFIKEEVDKNNKIITCDLLNPLDTKKVKKEQGPQLKVTELKPKYKKKGLDYILINYQNLSKYFKYFIHDSVYLCKNKIYIFNYNEKIINDYKRYKVNSIVKKGNDGNVLVISPKGVKINKIKVTFYFIKDTIIEIRDKIGDFLVS